MTNKSKGKSEKQKMSLSLAMIITCLPLGKSDYSGRKLLWHKATKIFIIAIHCRHYWWFSRKKTSRGPDELLSKVRAVQLKFGLTLQQIMDVVGSRIMHCSWLRYICRMRRTKWWWQMCGLIWWVSRLSSSRFFQTTNFIKPLMILL